MTTAWKVFWGATESDFLVFTVPNALFGLTTVLCESFWIAKSSPPQMNWKAAALGCLKALLWNWINHFIFALSNQRLPISIAEDKLNKPWRPLPNGVINESSARRVLLYSIPGIILTNYFLLGAYEESIVLVGLIWMYNDLQGGDESFVMRNLIIAIGYVFYNHGSSRVARGWRLQTEDGNSIDRNPMLSQTGQQWIVLISLIIFTTMQIQDFRDIEGDKKRNRKSMMLTWGCQASRWCTALAILAWTFSVPLLMDINKISVPLLASVVLGVYAAWRVMFLSGKKADGQSYKIWALWMVMLYTLPLTIGG